MTAELLQANLDSVQNIFLLFRWTLTAVGIGVILIGLVLFFYRGGKDTEKPTPYSARLTALFCFAAIGTGTIVYAWIWFGR